MKYTLTSKPNSQIQLDFVVTTEEVGKFTQKAAEHLSQDVKIPGFRPGKVPASVLEQKLGKEAIFEEAARMSIPQFYVEVVKEKNLEPIGRPEVSIKKLALGNDFEFTLEVYVLPEFEVANYKGLKAEKREVKVEDEEVNKVLDTLRNMRATYSNVERASQKGDRMEVDLLVKVDGKAIDGGKSENMPIEIGEEKFIPGFEAQVTGLKKGDKKTFKLTFPEKYHNKEIAGKEAEFEVEVKMIQEVNKPEIDDAFAQSLGGGTFKTAEDMKAQIRKNAELEATEKEKERYELALFEQVEKNTKMELPEVLVKGELDKMMNEMKFEIQNQGMELDKYFEGLKTTEDALKVSWRPQAERRVKAGLILRKISRLENIQVDPKEVNAEVEKVMVQHAGHNDAEQFNSPQYREYVEEQLKNRKVFEVIVKEAK
jgi:trigger factor